MNTCRTCKHISTERQIGIFGRCEWQPPNGIILAAWTNGGTRTVELDGPCDCPLYEEKREPVEIDGWVVAYQPSGDPGIITWSPIYPTEAHARSILAQSKNGIAVVHVTGKEEMEVAQ